MNRNLYILMFLICLAISNNYSAKSSYVLNDSECVPKSQLLVSEKEKSNIESYIEKNIPSKVPRKKPKYEIIR